MLDNIYDRDGEGESSRQPGERSAEQRGPMPDREVPLAPVATTDVINRWLDGELPEPAGLQGDSARALEFWRRIGDETDRRRHVVTPPHVVARIVASLPDVAAAPTPTTWWQREVSLSTPKVLALALAAFALGVIAMMLFAAN
jgi:hypothetical protein